MAFDVKFGPANGLSVLPTKEWQDNLSDHLASCSRGLTQDFQPVARRRKLDSTANNARVYPNWDEMYTMEPGMIWYNVYTMVSDGYLFPYQRLMRYKMPWTR